MRHPVIYQLLGKRVAPRRGQTFVVTKPSYECNIIEKIAEWRARQRFSTTDGQCYVSYVGIDDV